MSKVIAIYKTMLKATGKVVYIGQTTHPEWVGNGYFGGGNNIKKRYSLQQRRELFNAEIITTTQSQCEANELEQYYIGLYRTLEVDGGLNIEKGGLGSEGNLKRHSKPVLQFTKDGTFVAEYPSVAKAFDKTGVNISNICACCKGFRKSAGGYVWRWKSETA